MRFFCVFLLLLLVQPISALEPRDVFIIANKNEPKSKLVAEHYRSLRKVPAENIVYLDLPIGEDISRPDYDSKIVAPLRRELQPRRERVKVLLSVYGMPLRVGPVPMTEHEREESEEVRRELTTVRADLALKRGLVKALEEEASKLEMPSLKERAEERGKEIPPVEAKLHDLEEKDRHLQHSESEAALDSELMQLWWDDYPKERWVANPLYFQVPAAARRRMSQTIMTCRLDGPSAEVAMRLVDDAVATEEKGLEGTVYVDARGIKYDPKADPVGSGYGGYDESMREMASLLEKAKLQVVLDDTDALWPADSCPDCALYCGWYSVNHYIRSCKFRRGAVAWHLASLEAVSLHNPKTQWCGNLLKDGAAATLGAVAEPYTVAFPRPAEFFGFLATGEFTLVECYSRSLMISSWMITLVGDPLYNPYKNSPRLKSAEVLPSPKRTNINGDLPK